MFVISQDIHIAPFSLITVFTEVALSFLLGSAFVTAPSSKQKARGIYLCNR